MGRTRHPAERSSLAAIGLLACSGPGQAGFRPDRCPITLGPPGIETHSFVAGRLCAAPGKAVTFEADRLLMNPRGEKHGPQVLGHASRALLQLHPLSPRRAPEDGTGPQPEGPVAREEGRVVPDWATTSDTEGDETPVPRLLAGLLLGDSRKQNRELAGLRAKLAVMEQEVAALRLAVKRLSSGPPPAPYRAS